MQMERPVPETVAARKAIYLVSAVDADTKTAQSYNGMALKAWSPLADDYRDLAANLVRKFNL